MDSGNNSKTPQEIKRSDLALYVVKLTAREEGSNSCETFDVVVTIGASVDKAKVIF